MSNYGEFILTFFYFGCYSTQVEILVSMVGEVSKIAAIIYLMQMVLEIRKYGKKIGRNNLVFMLI